MCERSKQWSRKECLVVPSRRPKESCTFPRGFLPKTPWLSESFHHRTSRGRVGRSIGARCTSATAHPESRAIKSRVAWVARREARLSVEACEPESKRG